MVTEYQWWYSSCLWWYPEESSKKHISRNVVLLVKFLWKSHSCMAKTYCKIEVPSRRIFKAVETDFGNSEPSRSPSGYLSSAASVYTTPAKVSSKGHKQKAESCRLMPLYFKVDICWGHISQSTKWRPQMLILSNHQSKTQRRFVSCHKGLKKSSTSFYLKSWNRHIFAWKDNWNNERII